MVAALPKLPSTESAFFRKEQSRTWEGEISGRWVQISCLMTHWIACDPALEPIVGDRFRINWGVSQTKYTSRAYKCDKSKMGTRRKPKFSFITPALNRRPIDSWKNVKKLNQRTYGKSNRADRGLDGILLKHPPGISQAFHKQQSEREARRQARRRLRLAPAISFSL